MKREELIAMGISEENVEKIIADYGSAVQREQAKSVVKDDGSLDYDALGKITAEKETAAAQAKEQEIANNSENPGGGTAGGENKKTADVENAEKISFGKPAESAEAKDHYVL